jgi:hypothetical protein
MPALVYINGEPIPAQAAASALPGAVLENVGFGQYRARVNGYLLTHQDRKPVVIDVLR